jgi:hypothetical protein
MSDAARVGSVRRVYDRDAEALKAGAWTSTHPWCLAARVKGEGMRSDVFRWQFY